METGIMLEKLRKYLENTNADAETMAAFDYIRTYITRIVGFLMGVVEAKK